MTMTSTPLDRELAFFDQQRRSLLASGHAGKWACIVGERLVGLFDDDKAAFAAGVGEVGVSTPFLVRQVLLQEPGPSHSTLCMGVLGA